MLEPRASVHDGRLVVHYSAAVGLLWCVLAVAGLGFGFASVASGTNPQARFIGLGLGAICTFVAWFAVRPVVVADHTGVAVLPVFGTRVAYRWDEVVAVGVRSTRRSRGPGASLEIQATDDREAKVDGLLMGLTAGGLRSIDRELAAFVATVGVTRPIAVLIDDELV